MRLVRLLLLCVIIIFEATPVAALETTATPDREFTDSAPLLVTAYQTSASGTKLAAVEIGNVSTLPVDLNDWKLYVTANNARSFIPSVTEYSGLLLPGEHVVFSESSGTTYQFTYEGVGQITSLEFQYIKPDKNYRVAVAVKAASDVPYFRSYTPSGADYSSSATPFGTLAVPRSFYDDGLYVPPVAPDGLKVVEIYPYSSDCEPSRKEVLCGDYVKLMNTSGRDISLSDIVLRTDSSSTARTASNTVALNGLLPPRAVLVVSMTDDGGRLSLTNSGGYVWLEDTWGLVRYGPEQHYLAAGSSEQGYAYAWADGETWVWTTSPRPDGLNQITQPVTLECSTGKYRSPETGRCRTIEEAVNALSICEEGYERSPITNRCRKVAVATTPASLTPCSEGQERNPATNRCRTIASAVAELLPCDEGYERNPTTNRCRKTVSDTVPAAAFPVGRMTPAAGDIGGWLALGGVVLLAGAYGAWEWRHELVAGLRRIVGIFAHTK